MLRRWKMSESLYMMEIEGILEQVSEVACKEPRSMKFYGIKAWAIRKLTSHYGLNLDDAQSEVAAAAGEEP